MGLFDKLINEYIDIIEWVDHTSNTLVWKFPRADNEIKMGAKLTVRESQMAIFMNEGKIADIYGPGMYQLTTQNMPLLSTLNGWVYGFHSPFKADVYFVSTRQFTNQKWGTPNPVMIRDVEFGPVRLRAFGSFSFAVSDPALFLKEISATNPDFLTDDINQQMRNIAMSRGMDAIAASKIAVLDLTANYTSLSNLITEKIQPDFAELGLTLKKFLVENISLPPEVEQALDKRSEMGVIGNLGAYTQYQAANAIEETAANPGTGGFGATGMAIGAGAVMAGQLSNAFQATQFNNQTANLNQAQTPPPVPVAVDYFLAVNGKSEGPYNIGQLTGMIDSNSMVWKKGMTAWAAANTLPELKAIFDNIPPPLPL
ncbi:SPFH domain-containing protein [Mucilaginibacter paludis]|uniref:Virion core protein (Lumpy skin disease virus)-like protein n=1 Tax=Mucilaginibacter paludis DSM 18603 TaxID=714943 RepID=H1Y047_9SPHI|nr:SPFH domain-containing protein [Mucilaginibacter paludis]EHQ27956.1 virion core protein (lumpy skin disease virus)-like protein [Mucilaginibacter paludis DSM 18603]